MVSVPSLKLHQQVSFRCCIILTRTRREAILNGDLVQGADGNFYGVTSKGGYISNESPKFYGSTIFSITPSGVFTILHSATPAIPGSSLGNLVKGADGDFYFMTASGGPNNYGSIFKMSRDGTIKLLRHLEYQDGINPTGNLVQGADGNFYGMTASGGTYSYGTIFKITLGGYFSVIRHFESQTKLQPGQSLMPGHDGNLYGMTNDIDLKPKGTIFKITPTGNYTKLGQFPDATSGQPWGSLVQARDGYFYGMTNLGGSDQVGNIFKLCNNAYSALTSFDYFSTGGRPRGDLIQGTDGNFYGMTFGGGKTNSKGTIFKITSEGVITVLKHLDRPTTTGANPQGSLVQGTDGSFYGMTSYGGTNNSGTIFKITTEGVFTVLNHLQRSTIGAAPYGSLVQGTDGDFYGMTSLGGGADYGTIFKMTPTGTFTLLKLFNRSTRGAYPYGSLVQGADGNFYGMTSWGGSYDHGSIFKMTPTGTWTILKDLNKTSDGARPLGNLVQGSDGSFYGMTSEGGSYNGGTIFKLANDNSFTVLRHLNKDTDGGQPKGSLIIQKADPVAQAQSVSTPAGTAKAITLTATAPGSPLTYNIVSPPKNGTLSGSGANYTYTPKAGFTGTDAFTFTATWGCQTFSRANCIYSGYR